MATILIVEDDPDVREMLDVLLSSSGYGTDTAENGLAALEAMRDRKPCLVLLDMMMPVMDGWEFRERQLADPSLKDVPVLCISAVYDRAEVTSRLKAPCLPKPVDFSVLLREVRDACREEG